MRCYLLLRNHVELGPFSFAEIKAQKLKPDDRVWIKEQSTYWMHPTEINEFVVEDGDGTQNTELLAAINTDNAAMNEVTRDFTPEIASVEAWRTTESEDEEHTSTISSSEKKRLRKQRTFSKPHQVLLVSYIVSGLFITAILFRKMVENFYAQNARFTTVASTLLKKAAPEDVSLEEGYQHALTTELVPVDTATMKPVLKSPIPLNLKQWVHLDANDYQVGLLGGIKNLRLLLTNKSIFILDKVKIRLQYLKRNGTILKTEYLVLEKIAPKAFRSMAIAAQKSGDKVTCRIIEIQSEQNTAYEVQL